MNFILRLLINAVALWCAARFIDGIHYTGTWQGIVGLALVFGIINATIKPILNFFSFPIRILTLGLFTLVINAAMLLLTARIGAGLGIDFTVDGFWPALWGAICVSIVSLILNSVLVKDKDKDDR